MCTVKNDKYKCKIFSLGNLFYGENFKTCVRINSICLYGCKDEKQCDESIMFCIPYLIRCSL